MHCMASLTGSCCPLVGIATRSYLFVEDVAEAFDVVLHKGITGEVYNIGTQKERTVLDVATDIARFFKLPKEKVVHVRDRAFNDRSADNRGCVAAATATLQGCRKRVGLHRQGILRQPSWQLAVRAREAWL